MKKSKYNKIIEVEDGKRIAFNSVTCALAEVDNDFISILNNIENIDIEKLDEKSKDLVKNMSDGNYIIDDNIDELELLKYRSYSGKFSSGQFGVVIAPTLACNFACPYCYESAKSGMMSKEVQDSLIEMIENNAKGKRNVNVTWYGGEPLLAKNIIFDFAKRAIEICNRENVNYSSYIVTNGYLIDDEIVKGMKEAQITGAQITVDGPPSIHNKRRKLKNSDEETFDRIISNIKKLIDNGIKNVSIRINIDKTNVDNVEELLDILEANGLKDVSVNLGHVTAYTDACNGVIDNCLNVKEYAQNDTKYQNILSKRGYEISSRYPFYPSIKSNYCCADHIGAFVVDPEGYMYKCWNDVGNIEKAVGNVTNRDKVDEKMFATNMKYMLWSPFEYEECKKCSVLPICMGGCPYKGLKNKKPDCEKWIYNLEETIVATYRQNLKKECTDSL